MTKKDYVLIAQAVAEVGSRGYGDIGPVAHQIADALATDNPRFDRERFLKACGL